jgi:hypothetical protein
MGQQHRLQQSCNRAATATELQQLQQSCNSCNRAATELQTADVCCRAGVKGSGEEDAAAALPVALGVRVRFEKDSPGSRRVFFF